jgi:tetratricopeptide (TPR) repeat protein/DNA-binding winged helix-turn-helix (wHTH) protein
MDTPAKMVRSIPLKPSSYGFRLKDRLVVPEQEVIVREGKHHHISSQAMKVLLCLIESYPHLVSTEYLLRRVWGKSKVNKSTLTRTIAEIRRTLEEHQASPEFIQAVARKGYRLTVEPTAFTEVEQQPGYSAAVDASIHQASAASPPSLWFPKALKPLANSKLFSVSIAFIVSTWVLIQALDVLLPIFNIPDWGMKLAVLLVVSGFPLLLLYIWLKELKMKKQIFNATASKQQKARLFRQFGIDFLFIGVLSVLVGFLVLYLIQSIESDTQPPAEATEQTSALVQQVEVPIQDNAIVIQPISDKNLNLIPEHFAKTIASEIRSTISNHTPFHVVAADLGSLQKEPSSWLQHAREFGARYLLHIDIAQVSEQVLIEISLIDTLSQVHTWNQVFKSDRKNLLDLQKSLYSKLIIALKLLLDDTSTGPQVVIDTQSIDAYEAYIKGKSELAKANSESDLDRAEQWFLKALNLDGAFTLATSGLCQTYLEKYDLSHAVSAFEMAQSVCGSLIHHENHNPESYTSLGTLYRTSGDFAQAISYYQKALTEKPSYLPAIRALARTYAEAGDHIRAEQLFKQTIRLEPGYWRNHQEFGDYFFSYGKYAEAIEHYKRVLYLNRQHAESINRLGASYFLSGQFDFATEVWKESVKITPSETSHSNLGSAYFFNRDFDRAIYHYRQAININPSSTSMWANLGDAYKYKGNRPLAEQAFQTALDLVEKNLAVTPGSPLLQSLKIRYLTELNHCESVTEDIRKINQTPAKDPYVFYYQALAYNQCGQDVLTKESIQSAISSGYPAELLVKDIQFDNLSDFITSLQQGAKE